jgi:hypothetical protein
MGTTETGINRERAAWFCKYIFRRLFMEHENNYASKGVAGTALGIGIGALGAELLGGNLGNLFGGGRGACDYGHMGVTRREADMAAEISELKTEKKLLESNIYTDGKILELYKYVDGKFAGVEAQLCQQNVVNTQVAANLACLTNTVNTLSGLTKTIIPIDNICPPPMERYNSWVAPTAAATT